MVVVGNDYFAAHQHVVSDLNKVGSSDVHKMAYPDMLSNNNPWSESLIVVTMDGFEPESLFGRKILSYGDSRQTSQVGARTNLNPPNAQLSRDKIVARNCEGRIDQVREKYIKSILSHKSRDSIQVSPLRFSLREYIGKNSPVK